jgi:two-component system response regulator DevR
MAVRGASITIMMVDDHQMFVESVARLLAQEPDFELVGVAGTVAAAISLAEATQPNVAVVDFNLPDGTGADVAGRLRTLSPDTRVVILTGLDDERAMIAAIDAGCTGFVTKDKALSELGTAVRLAQAGEAYVPPHLLAKLLPRLGRSYRGLGADLTRREREVLNLLADGRSNPAIAAHLVISVHTVRNHVQNVLAKLGAHSKLEAVAVAAREGLLDAKR